jgi:hypothetical protein
MIQWLRARSLNEFSRLQLGSGILLRRRKRFQHVLRRRAKLGRDGFERSAVQDREIDSAELPKI